MINCEVGEIYHFSKYHFTDESNNVIVKSRFTVVLISQETTSLVAMSAFGANFDDQSFFMPILRDKTCSREKIRQLLRKNKYKFLDQNRYCCPAINDMHNINNQKVDYISAIDTSDVNPLLNKIKSAFHSGCLPKYMYDPYVRGAILLEWTSLRDN